MGKLSYLAYLVRVDDKDGLEDELTDVVLNSDMSVQDAINQLTKEESSAVSNEQRKQEENNTGKSR